MTWGWLFLAAGWLGALDCVRRPAWQWAEADRDKIFWVMMLVILGPLMIWFYLLFCLPKLLQASGRGVGDQQFTKSA